ncbi:MAG: PRD domain-containing protein [Chloroflexi bacterium]|nr:PRD domain-containing protein [Chloroflexota bacterium]
MSLRAINRKEEILKELALHEGYLTSSYLSKKLGVSPRTIRQDIKMLAIALNEKHIALQAIPSKGYFLDQENREKLAAQLESILQTNPFIPTLPVDRVKFIVKILLFENETSDIDSLTERLCVSRSTIEKDILDVKRWLSQQGLDLSYKKEHGLFIIGNEILIRYAMVNYLADSNFSSSLPELSDYSNTPGLVHFNSIKHILEQIHETEKVSFSDAEFLNLAIYLSVTLARLEKQKEIMQNELEGFQLENKKEYGLAFKVAQLLEQTLAIRLSEAECLQLTRYLTQANISDPSVQNLAAPGEGDLASFIKKAIEEIKHRFYCDFSNDEELIISLSHYLNSLINREKYKTLTKNPGLGEIATQYPDALEIAVAISEMVQEAYGITADEHEIGYIALYVCAGIERQKGQIERVFKKVVIICATGSGGSQLLAVKIRRNFPNLRILGIYPTYRLNEAIKQHPDFIISTNPLEHVAYPVVQISHLLNNADLVHIKKTIYETERSDKIRLCTLFKPELFFPEIHLIERNTVIRFLCQKIEGLHLGDENFTNMVLEREALFSTAIGNLVAIPHALKNSFSDSWIAVGILKKPILWGNELAQLILLLNIDNSKEENFSTIYEILYDKVNDKNTIEQLIRTTNFEAFMKVINEQR